MQRFFYLFWTPAILQVNSIGHLQNAKSICNNNNNNKQYRRHVRSCFHLGACDFNVSSTALLCVSSHRRFIGHRVTRSALCLFTIPVLLVCCLGASLCSSRPLVAFGLRSIEIRSCVNNIDNVIISNATGLMIMFFEYQIIRL